MKQPGSFGDIKWLLTFLSLVLLTSVLTVLGVGGFGLSEIVRRVFVVGSAGIVVVLGLVIARRVSSGYVVALGAGMNMFAMLVNGGAMPVDAALAVDVGAFPAEELSSRVGTLLDNSKDVPLARTDINLYPLADRFTLDLPTQPTRVYSLGDFVLALGVVAAAAEVAIKLAYTRQTE